MKEVKDVNPIVQMWLKIIFSSILVYKLNEYLKIVEIALVHVLGSVEDEKSFNDSSFMKQKLMLSTNHKSCIVCLHALMFSFFSLFGKFFPRSW
jgi:hypothetical protein